MLDRDEFYGRIFKRLEKSKVMRPADPEGVLDPFRFQAFDDDISDFHFHEYYPFHCLNLDLLDYRIALNLLEVY